MIREDQVNEALKLLKPADRAACMKYLNAALDDLAITKAANQHLRDIASKEARKSLTAYSKVLRRTEVAYKRLPDGLKQTLGTLGRISGQGEVNFGALINDCDRVFNAPHAWSTKDYFKYNAAAWAKNVLNLLDKESPLTHDGDWPKLAAILHGDPETDDLFHHCTQYNSSMNSGQK
jgi:hypothetical protein